MAKHEREMPFAFVCPLYVCRDTVCAILARLALNSESKALGEEEEDGEDDVEEEERCLGPALEYALNLIKIHDAANSSIACATYGRGTRGPGKWKLQLVQAEERALIDAEHAQACEYFASISPAAAAAATTGGAVCSVHLFCYGPSMDFGLAALLALTPHVFYQSLANARTLLGALSYNANTQLPRTDFICSNNLVPMYISGANGPVPNQAPTASRLWHFAPSNSLTIFLGHEVKNARGVAAEDAYVQWISRDATSGKECVGTERILSFGAVHEDACAVLIAKRAVAIALVSETDARRHVCNELYNLSRCLPPNQFERVALPLFHFYRSALMRTCGGNGEDDEVVLGRERLLHQTDFVAALLLISPKLFALRRGVDKPMEMPLSTLCLESDCALVLDQYSRVVVWFGNDLERDAAERTRAVELANVLSADRYPASIITVCEEADHDAAWLRARLSPEHKDSAGAATNMAASSSHALMSKLWNLPPGDDLTYARFIKQVLEGGEV